VVEVITTDEFLAWYQGLDEEDVVAVTRAVDRLAEVGVTLGFPHSSAIVGSRIAMRELRVQSRGRPFRVFYVFDPKRQAVLLLGGDKTGDDRFYEQEIPRAEAIYAQFLVEEAERDKAKSKEERK
jgi:hypothetical protein